MKKSLAGTSSFNKMYGISTDFLYLTLYFENIFGAFLSDTLKEIVDCKYRVQYLAYAVLKLKWIFGLFWL